MTENERYEGPIIPSSRDQEMQVVSHSSDTLRGALISGDPKLQDLYDRFSTAEKKLLNEAFNPHNALFRPITVCSPSDWIPSHPEPAETFQEFYRKSERRIPSPQRRTIYVQTIGQFGDSDRHTQEYIAWLTGYCQAFFHGLPVKVQGPISISQTGCRFRVNDSTHNLQIHAGDLLRYLKTIKPPDAFCIVGATMIDLYPQDSWNFVFGMASLTEGGGVFSFTRYDDDFYSSGYKGRLKGKRPAKGDYSVFNGYYTPPITSALLLRSCKTLTHEIGHMFGLRHCKWLQCVMQGSNHLEESDRRPLDLCPICLRKLHSAIGFPMAGRYKALLRWMEDDGRESDSEAPGKKEILKPLQSFQEHREWIRTCLDILL
ncbi:archaemetzincin-2-like isoform X5 [Aquarana catesbeiana]|uniref:archaemetzincin-2-like isoform X2 n=1 Tax=Aquarana catesbeiana TaxID=8400 RepID=UPI003CC9AA2F